MRRQRLPGGVRPGRAVDVVLADRPDHRPDLGSTTTSTAPSRAPIVGLWRQTHTCGQLVGALEDAGLATTAPATVLDYFPASTPQAVRRKADLCRGAKPQAHAHFFSASGEFGSLDQHGNRVDDGAWQLVDDHTVRISDGTFRFRVRHDTLVLRPVIKDGDRRTALASPLDFSTASWQVAVTYGGRPWHRAPCHEWC